MKVDVFIYVKHYVYRFSKEIHRSCDGPLAIYSVAVK